MSFFDTLPAAPRRPTAGLLARPISRWSVPLAPRVSPSPRLRTRWQPAAGPRATGQPLGGFTLVEVIIVTMVLSVLLLGVWSLFAMQQRTLERGQRLSRQARVTLALQRLFQEDLARTAGRLPGPSLAPGSRPLPPSSPRVAEPASSDFAFDVSVGQASPAPMSAGETEAVAPQFLFAGGSDWLIVDVIRPAYQMEAFETRVDDERPLAAMPTLSSGSLAGQNLDPESLPERLPTPFERVIYLWLTDAEIQETSGLIFGQEADSTFSAADRGETGSPAGNRPSSSDSDDRRDEGPAGTRSSRDGLPSDATTWAQPRRTLLRIRTDWSWPREEETAGATWDQALGSDPADDPPLDFAAGLTTDMGSTTATRRQWLRRLLWATTGDYRQYHLHAGHASAADGPADTAATRMEPDQDSPTPTETEETATAPGLPNRQQPQVDWFPEVVAGKFQYFDGSDWQDSFSGQSPPTGGHPVPWAVRLQFAVDARRIPQQLSADTVTTDERVAAAAGDTNLGLPTPSTPRGLDPLLPVGAGDRPEFPHLAVFTFRTQASRRDRSLDDNLPLPADPEAAGDADLPSDWEGSSGSDNLFAPPSADSSRTTSQLPQPLTGEVPP